MNRWTSTVAAISVLTLLAATAPADAPKVGDSAADFSLKTVNGNALKLSDQTKEGPVVLVVLRGWPGYQCPLCTRQVKELVGQAKALADTKARVLFVYPGPAAKLDAHASEFFGKTGLPEGFTFVTDPDYKFTNLYGIRWDAPNETAFPSTFVIDGSNTIRFAKTSKTHGDRAATKDVLKVLADVK